MDEDGAHTVGDIWNHIILKQYYTEDEDDAIDSDVENASKLAKPQDIPRSSSTSIKRKEKDDRSPSPPETSRPPRIPQSTTSSSSSSSSSKKQAQQQRRRQPPPPPPPSQTLSKESASSRASASSSRTTSSSMASSVKTGPKQAPAKQKRSLPSGPSLVTSLSKSEERASSSNRILPSGQVVPVTTSGIAIDQAKDDSSYSSSSSSISSSTTMSSEEPGKKMMNETAGWSKITSNSKLMSSTTSLSSNNSNSINRKPPPPPPIQPKQRLSSSSSSSLKRSYGSGGGPPRTMINNHRGKTHNIQQHNRRAQMQQTRAMASIPNLTNWDKPEYASSPKRKTKPTIGGGLFGDNNTTNPNTRSGQKATAATAATATSSSAPSNGKKGDTSENTSWLGRIRKHATGFTYFIIWAAWLIGGAAFYGFGREGQKLGWAKGFYMAVNIGYSIGFGYPPEVDEGGYLWFSTVYVLIGSSLVAVALGFFADKIVEDADDWFVNLLQKQEYKRRIAGDKHIITRVRAWITYHSEQLRSIGIWLFWVCLMITYSMIHIGWPISQAQYFAVSSCSTGGHWSIPEDSPDWFYGVTGAVVALGVPIMGVAMATIGQFVASSKKKELEDIKDTINAPVTPQEIKMMQQFGLEDGDGEVDEAEFIILCMCRLGTDPRVIEYIGQRFRKLDVDGGGSLSMREIVGRDSLDSDELLVDISEGNEDESESNSNHI